MQLVEIQAANQLLLVHSWQCGEVESFQLPDRVLQHLRTLQANSKLFAHLRTLVQLVYGLVWIDLGCGTGPHVILCQQEPLMIATDN